MIKPSPYGETHDKTGSLQQNTTTFQLLIRLSFLRSMNPVCMFCEFEILPGEGRDDGYGNEHLTCMKEADRRVKAGLCTMCNEPLGDESSKQRHAKCEKEGRYEWY